jgi:peptidoglycan/LPS O-acetylase OafA/YrhL
VAAADARHLMHARMPMPAGFSLYLDIVRFVAAVLVVLSHVAKEQIFPAWLTPYVPDFGREAVILFFVLSGYVIAYTRAHKHQTVDHYMVARLTRIYSVAIPVLLLSVGLALWGLRLDPSLYTGLYQYESLHIYIPLHLLFAGELWTLSEQPFTVAPYWSLGYEVWYYLLFVFLSFYQGWRRWLWCAAWLLLVGFKLVLLLPIWLAGVALYQYRDRFVLSATLAWLGFIGSLAAMVCFEAANIDAVLLSMGEASWQHYVQPWTQWSLGSATPFLADYAMCGLVMVNFYCAYYLRFDALKQWAAVIQSGAAYTFTLYLLHAPVMIFLVRHVVTERQQLSSALLILTAIGLSTWLIGQLTERRKQWWQPLFQWVVQCGATLVLRIAPLRWLLCTQPAATQTAIEITAARSDKQ